MGYSHRVTRRRKLCIHANTLSTFHRDRLCIYDVRHLASEDGLPELCQQQVRKATPYLLQTQL